jgi:hypothetical protein
VTSIPSFITGMKFRSKTGSVGPCILWEKARPSFIDPTKVGFLALDPPATCSSFSLRSWWSSSLGLLPLSSPEGPWSSQNWEQILIETAQNKNTIYKPRVIRGLYRRKLNIEAKSQEETGTETSFGVLSPQGGAAWGGPTPPGGEEPPNSVSCPFSSRDFSYLVKIAKILMENFNVNLFWLELLPIWKWILQVPAYCPGWILLEKSFE